MSAYRKLLDQAAEHAIGHLDGLDRRPPAATASPAELLDLLGGALPDGPRDPAEAIDRLALAGERGLVASNGPRYFGFVIGGTLPVALAADWLATAWDQNTGVYAIGPATATAEQVAAEWLVDLLGLPPQTTVGFPTGCQMAHLTALAAARHHVLARAGWDVERDGLSGAPAVTVVVGEQRHVTIDAALRYLGFGAGRSVVVPADGQGRMRVDALADALDRHPGPAIVCTQIGDVNSGAIDPVGQICAAAQARGGWVHVDGAFGLWAAASPRLRPLLAGYERADSWASDAHKWLNVPYDCGLVFVAHEAAHRAAMAPAPASYLHPTRPGERDCLQWMPEFSRRARGVPVWAALRTLGRTGLAELVERSCALARRFADQLAAVPGVHVLGDVVLNQVLVRFGDDDAVTREVIARLQAGGVCWFGGTEWHGRAAMRISVCSWQTTESDVDRSVAAIRAAVTGAQ